MEKIPTALELFQKGEFTKIQDAMIEFAKMHVEAALKEASDYGKKAWDWTTEECSSITEDAYPLTNIK